MQIIIINLIFLAKLPIFLINLVVDLYLPRLIQIHEMRETVLDFL